MASIQNEYPALADLRTMMKEQPLPSLAQGLIDPACMTNEEATINARTVLKQFNTALTSQNPQALTSCFYPSQAYWKDIIALTYHLCTFNTPGVIATALIQNNSFRKIENGFTVDGIATFLPITPVLQFIDCPIIFRTQSPAGTCSGKVMLVPVKLETETDKPEIVWKIWILSTRLESLDIHPEDESLLQTPARDMHNLESLETEVFIIGGGNAGVTLSARLKALGVESVIAERNASPGDNWALRYDSLHFHIPTTVCEMPFLYYDKKFRTPHLLSKDELASQIRRYVEAFNLNYITSAKIQNTQYDSSARKWRVEIETPSGQQTFQSRHLVIATGFGTQKPRIPNILGEADYEGISSHSTDFKNGMELKQKGVKSVIVIGSANTAFDILEDCHAAGLQLTMNVRSPTYVVPLEYICEKRSLGFYDNGVEEADKRFLSLPAVVDAALTRDLFASFASEEPNRYEALKAAGFPVLDSNDPDQELMHNLLERAGGHYVDIGGTKLIEEGKVAINANVEPVAYTKTGLRFSDGSTVDADAIIWCTGYADGNIIDTAADILGTGDSEDNKIDHGDDRSHRLGPREIAAQLDATWGVDAEGEIRGMWKRNPRLENFWVMGGYTQLQRWHTKTLAMQIKAALENILPPAYLDTPQDGIN